MLKDQVKKLRNAANRKVKYFSNKKSTIANSLFEGQIIAYNSVLELIAQEPDYKGLLEECLLMARVYKALLNNPSPAVAKADGIIKRLEEVLK